MKLCRNKEARFLGLQWRIMVWVVDKLYYWAFGVRIDCWQDLQICLGPLELEFSWSKPAITGETEWKA